jgi:hypothetical protein
MHSGVSNFYRYQQVAAAANQRYLAALAVVDDPTPSYRQAERFVQPKVVRGRSPAGVNPARRPDVQLFQAVLRGGHLLHGFRKAAIRRLLKGAAQDPTARRRHAVAVGQLL